MEHARVRKERDLYRRLLDLAHQDALRPLLDEALGLVVEVAGADQGYLEVTATHDAAAGLSMARGCTDEEIDGIRAVTSRGIVAEALASGRTVTTESARRDDRFVDRPSVRGGRIEAVICTPIAGVRLRGVVYLQGRDRFSPDAVELVESFCRHVAPFVDRLLDDDGDGRVVDPTRRWRERLDVDPLVGRSDAMASVLEQIALVAPLEITVLLEGAPGTGKTVVARAVADNGPRRGGPFVELNCATLPDELVESELFGAERGAHATAFRRLPGKVAAASGGTLFLDEIGELSVGSQAKLLQLLQSGLYYRLGGSEPLRADVRVIAASNADLAERVRDGRFRDDLYYRLRILPIRLPSLAERAVDVVPLAEHFVRQASRRHGVPRATLSPSARAALEMGDWPGNVRQLANVVEAAVIRATAEGGTEIGRVHLFPDEHGIDAEPDDALGFQAQTRRFQKLLLERTLDATGWNVAEAARRLDLARSHVYNLMRSFSLTRSADPDR